jgi:hypothetical protein
MAGRGGEGGEPRERNYESCDHQGDAASGRRGGGSTGSLDGGCSVDGGQGVDWSCEGYLCLRIEHVSAETGDLEEGGRVGEGARDEVRCRSLDCSGRSDFADLAGRLQGITTRSSRPCCRISTAGGDSLGTFFSRRNSSSAAPHAFLPFSRSSWPPRSRGSLTMFPVLVKFSVVRSLPTRRAKASGLPQSSSRRRMAKSKLRDS